MADKKSRRRKPRDESPEKPTKEEYEIAKYLRFNAPCKEGKLLGMSVQCFIASDAVNKLLESKWGTGTDIKFGNRHSCVEFCDRLLKKGLFHRALKVERKKDRDKRKKKDTEAEEEEGTKSKREKKGKKGKEGKEEEKTKDLETTETKKEDEESAKDIKKKDEDKDKKKKKEKKLRLDMHDHQVFKDGEEVYVWIYDPVRPRTFIIGLLLVLGAIAVCLFPLWPPEMRQGVYYLSLAGAGFVGVILGLSVVRLILFCIIWVLTFGKHHFWLLPNLTEDVSFMDSFRPLYKHDVAEQKDKDKDTAKTSEVKKDSQDDKTQDITEKKESKKISKEENQDAENSEEEEETGTEAEDENGYEIIGHEDVDEENQNKDEKHPEETKKTK